MSEEPADLQYSKDIENNIVSDERLAEVEKENKKLRENNKAIAFDLDAALDTYDPSFPRYIPSVLALEFFNLMRLVQGSDFAFDSPPAHFFMVDMLLGEIDDPMMFPYSEEVCKTITIDKLALSFMESRGMAKSSVVITFFVVYSAIKGTLPNGMGDVYFYLVLSASTKGGARVNSKAVESLCCESKFINDYFEKTRYTETEIEFVRKGKGPAAGRTFIARFQGVGTGIRGQRAQAGSTKSGGATRPNAIIFDDIILNTAAAYSKTIQSTLDDILNSDAENALLGGGNGRIISCFTPFHYSDVNVAPVLAGTTTPIVVPLAKMFDLEKPVNARDIKSSWPAMHPPKAIAKQFNNALKKKTIGLFIQERMLRLTSDQDRLIPDSCIQWTDMKLISDNIHAYNIYITTDYTTTSGENSDFSGVATWAVGSNEDWFMLNISLRKRTIQEQYNSTIDEASYWKRQGKNVEIGVEIDGSQAAHIHGLEKEMMRRGEWFSFAKDKNNPHVARKGILSRSTGVKKHERFRIAAEQTILRNKVWLPEHMKDNADMKEFILQLKGATHENFTRADDGPDLLSMLNSIIVYLPTVEQATATKDGYHEVVDGSYYYTARDDNYGGSAYDNY